MTDDRAADLARNRELWQVVNERFTDALARAVAQRPGWKALVFPPIPLGTGGANEIGGIHSWPGTYSIRATTLRAVFMDLADELIKRQDKA